MGGDAESPLRNVRRLTDYSGQPVLVTCAKATSSFRQMTGVLSNCFVEGTERLFDRQVRARAAPRAQQLNRNSRGRAGER
jgi:hypothetical protein